MWEPPRRPFRITAYRYFFCLAEIGFPITKPHQVSPVNGIDLHLPATGRNMDNAKVRALVFDLAGVLLDFGGVESLKELSGGRIGPQEFHQFLVAFPGG